jgi:hypothetical protein
MKYAVPERGDISSERTSKVRSKAMRQELLDLSALNTAMFKEMFSSGFPHQSFLSAKFDVTNSQKDSCEIERTWDFRVEGDFYLVKRVKNCVYVIVGDATGHSPYAGGLKLFVAAALKIIFDRFETSHRAPSGAKVLRALNSYFVDVGRRALDRTGETHRLQDGADAVIVRFELDRRKVTFASAGIPVVALRSGRSINYGDFDNTRGVRFPDRQIHKMAFEPLLGRIDMRKSRFLAIATDGFRNLKRVARGSKNPDFVALDSFGDAAIREALLTAVESIDLGQNPTHPAGTIASALVRAAQIFRKDHKIPEMADDDRLVVIIDLKRIFGLT